MDKNLIANKVRAIVYRILLVDSKQVTDASSFVEDLGADLSDISVLIFELEMEFEIEISNKDAENILTNVGEAIAYIQHRFEQLES